FSSVNAEAVGFNSSNFNISFNLPFDADVPGRHSAEIAFLFFFLRVAPVIYQFCFVYPNDKKEFLYKDHEDKAVSIVLLIGSIDAIKLLISDFFNVHIVKCRDFCRGNGMTLNLFTVGYATRTLHFAAITYYFSSASAYHWITATVLFSATTTLNFAKTDIRFENPNSSFLYKIDWLYHFKEYTNDKNDKEKGKLKELVKSRYKNLEVKVDF
ncbi:22054_t:CDS:2, partial [Dentiscutata erythropus]